MCNVYTLYIYIYICLSLPAVHCASPPPTPVVSLSLFLSFGWYQRWLLSRVDVCLSPPMLGDCGSGWMMNRLRDGTKFFYNIHTHRHTWSRTDDIAKDFSLLTSDDIQVLWWFLLSILYGAVPQTSDDIQVVWWCLLSILYGAVPQTSYCSPG